MEIGCGRGVAIRLVCDSSPDIRMTAIDRSAAMVEAATQRNADLIAAGRVRVQLGQLESVLEAGNRYDIVFAINVNRFWVKPVVPALRALRRMLRPGGEFYLFYEAPTSEKATEIAQTILLALPPAGVLEFEELRPAADPAGRLVGVRGHMP